MMYRSKIRNQQKYFNIYYIKPKDTVNRQKIFNFRDLTRKKRGKTAYKQNKDIAIYNSLISVTQLSFNIFKSLSLSLRQMPEYHNETNNANPAKCPERPGSAKHFYKIWEC